LFKVLGDETRLQIIGMLAAAKGELCACEIEASIAHLSQPTISHHLRLLKEEGLVTAERRGTWVYYTLRPLLVEQLRRAAAQIE
jgi:ArsR family transcriptional regulator